MRIVKWLFVLLFALSTSSAPLRAQTSSTAVLSGRVTDPSGAVVPEAQVTLRNVGTNAAREQMTNDNGRYVFSAVERGSYTLTVTKAGFQTATVPGLELVVTKSYSADVALKVGTTTTIVEVTAEAGLELQTTDATIGNVIAGEEIRRLPTQFRDATELLQLQPGATPLAIQNGGVVDSFGTTGGSVAGARSDQNAVSLDGIDVTINAYEEFNFHPVFPLGVDTISEFRVGISNPNATFGFAGGAQESVASRSGTNAIHGVGYWYDQNTAFNANEWDNNHTIDSATGKTLPRPTIRDNRVGVSIGGPIRKDKTFFFSNYEVRRYDQSFRTIKQVPSADLRGDNPLYPNGAIFFTDGTLHDLKALDPRGIGLSTTIKDFWHLMPLGNDPSAGADGCLNVCGYLTNIPANRKDDSISFRLDHNFTPNLHFFGRYEYSRVIDPGLVQQTDLVPAATGGAARFLGFGAQLGDGATAGLDWVMRSNLTNSIRFGWIRARIGTAPVRGDSLAAQYNLPGTNSADGPVTLIPGLNSASIPLHLDLPTDIPSNYSQINSANFQIRDDLNWTKGTHTFAFGAAFSVLPVYFRDDTRIQGPLDFISAEVDGNNGNLIVPSTYGDGSPGFQRLFAAALGMVDSTAVVVVRDKNLNPLPAGTPVIQNTRQGSHFFYAQDTWRMRPSLTLSYGLTYGWQTPQRERDGKGMVLVDSAGNPFDSAKYIEARRSAALKGQIYNPEFFHLPYGKMGMSGAWNTDWTNFGPRVSLAWSPARSGGFLGKIMGNQKTVVRMGYGIVYDRLNFLTETIVNLGFSQNLTLPVPQCNDPVAVMGPGCTPGNPDPVLSAFRVGVDGPNIPVPVPGPATLPYASTPASPEFWDFEVDPNLKQGRNHLVDFSIQRELPGRNLIEIGYVGRLGRNLGNSVALVAAPYMFVDPTPGAGGQSFAQAFDCVAQVLRGLTPPTSSFPCTSGGSLVAQPWFENQLPAGWGAANCGTGTSNTQCLANLQGGNFVTGAIAEFGGVFGTIDAARVAAGLPPFVNQQQADLEMRQSHDFADYHALTATWRNSGWKGLQFDLNYTFSKTMDNGGRIALFANGYDDAFNPMADHGPAYYDRTHVFNATFNYNLPFGTGHLLGSSSGGVNRLIGGWYVAGIFTAASGVPECATQGFAYGGGVITDNPVCEIPTSTTALSTGVHTGVFATTAACNGQVYGTPAASGGTGLNIFADPGAAACSFRPVLLSQDTRNGRDNPFRGLGQRNLDFRLGKETSITERFKAELSADFFNVFNHVVYVDPGAGAYTGGMDLTGASNASFGVISTQAVPADRLGGSRWIEFGLRFTF